jgi:biotin carboxylase
MKKILLLGGSAQQVIAIETAGRLGFYTILCDFLPDNPGQYVADKFFSASTTDKEKVLEIARTEKIDGILAYASDPAAPTAAYVAEKMGLPGNPYKSVEILCNKDKFREFLAQNGFSSPGSKGYDNVQGALRDLQNGEFSFPVIVKPVDSSGSKGVAKIVSLENAEEKLECAQNFSRKKRIIVEEFVENKHRFLTGGDIFVEDGKIVLWGLMNCHRDESVNPLVPVGKSFPPELDERELCRIKFTLQKIVEKLGIISGGMNVELVVDKNGKVFPLDIGPRNGGNMIPDLLGMIFRADVVEMSVKAAMGQKVTVENWSGIPFYATHNLHTNRNGIFRGIDFADELKPFIVRTCIYKKIGEKVEFFDNAQKVLGIVFLKFSSMEQMQNALDKINEYIFIKVD